MIRMYHVTKVYPGGPRALGDVSLQVQRGEFSFIAGPSGAGKTTLIKLLLGEERPTMGQILVSGQNVPRLRPRRIAYLRRRIGVVFQDFRLIPTRTVFQNVALRLDIEGAAQSYIQKKVRFVLKRVGLEGRDEALPPQLSGGEQQRVAIARAIVADPVLVLADEPTGNLDPDLTRSIMGLLREINRGGASVVVATHSQELLAGTEDRIIRLDKGRLVS